jgi:hypothetical protein
MDTQDSPWLGLGETNTFLLIVFFVIGHGGYIHMSFFLGFQVENLEVFEIRIPFILEVHNFFL